MYQSKFVEVLPDYLNSSKFVDENFFSFHLIVIYERLKQNFMVTQLLMIQF